MLWVAAGMALASFWWPLTPLSLIILGIRQRALATLLHEASHRMLARSAILGRVIGCVAGWMVLQTFYQYQKSHCRGHHTHLGDAGLDPDRVNYSQQGLFTQTPETFLKTHLWDMALGRKILPNLRNLIRDRLLCRDFASLPLSARIEYGGFIAFWLAVLAVAYWFGGLYYIALWLVAYLTVFQTLNWVIELSEHFPKIASAGSDLEMTRNRQGHWIEKHITAMHGEQWHLVHHLFPGVPFWRLEEAHHILMSDPDYAAANANNAGIFTRGKGGEPSILRKLAAELAAFQASYSSVG